MTLDPDIAGRLRNLAEDWDNWPNPFSRFASWQDMRRDMEREAKALGPSQALPVVGTATRMAQSDDPCCEAMMEFAELYAWLHPDDMREALARELGPDGPVAVVEILGTVGDSETVELLAGTIEIGTAPADLQIALAGALGEIGGEAARRQLSDWARQDLADRVHEGIRIALRNIDVRSREP